MAKSQSQRIKKPLAAQNVSDAGALYKFGLSIFGTFVLIAAVSASAQNAQKVQNLLKGNVVKQTNAKPNSDLVERYGDAATDPAIADAVRKAQGQQTTEELKEKASAYEVLQNGTFKPGADPTMALKYGYVPPNMSPEQAAIMAQHLPKLPRLPHPITPEDIARMAGEPETQRAMIEPMDPYIPYPEAFAKAHGLPTSRQLQPIPQQRWPGQMAGIPGMSNIPVMPMMGAGSGMGYGLSREEIAAQNQKLAEQCIRARFGPVNIPVLQPGHNAIAEQARRKQQAGQHIAESDHQSVVGVCDNLGNEITGISYDPYGQATVLHGGTVMPTFMYKGMYRLDRAGDLYLSPYGRPYSPQLGRWLTREPLADLMGATNLYSYADNDPINEYDPDGLWPKGLPGKGKAQKKLPGYLKKRVPCLTDEAAKSLSDSIIDKLDWPDLRKAGKAANVDVGKDVGLGLKYALPWTSPEDKASLKATLMKDVPNMNNLTPQQVQVLSDFMGKLPAEQQGPAQQVINSFSPPTP